MSLQESDETFSDEATGDGTNVSSPIYPTAKKKENPEQQPIFLFPEEPKLIQTFRLNVRG
jgi:hypothetical protein